MFGTLSNVHLLTSISRRDEHWLKHEFMLVTCDSVILSGSVSVLSAEALRRKLLIFVAASKFQSLRSRFLIRMLFVDNISQLSTIPMLRFPA